MGVSLRLTAREDFDIAKAGHDELDRVALLAALIFPRAGADQRQELPKTITELPLTGFLRKEAVSTANEAFARALGRMEARNPRDARRTWDAEAYVDRVLTPDMLPIDTDYALSLFESFIVMEAIDAAVDADAED